MGLPLAMGQLQILEQIFHYKRIFKLIFNFQNKDNLQIIIINMQQQHQNSTSIRAGNNMINNNLLTASLTAKVSNLKSLSEAYKEMEKSRHQAAGQAPMLQVNGTSTHNNTIDATGDGDKSGDLSPQDQDCSGVPGYMQNEYARMMAQGVINLNTDLHPVEDSDSQTAKVKNINDIFSATSPNLYSQPREQWPQQSQKFFQGPHLTGNQSKLLQSLHSTVEFSQKLSNNMPPPQLQISNSNYNNNNSGAQQQQYQQQQMQQQPQQFLLKGQEFGAHSTRNNPGLAITPYQDSRVLQSFKGSCYSPLERTGLHSVGEDQSYDQNQQNPAVDYHFSQYRMLELQSAGQTNTVLSQEDTQLHNNEMQRVQHQHQHLQQQQHQQLKGQFSPKVAQNVIKNISTLSSPPFAQEIKIEDDSRPQQKTSNQQMNYKREPPYFEQPNVNDTSAVIPETRLAQLQSASNSFEFGRAQTFKKRMDRNNNNQDDLNNKNSCARVERQLKNLQKTIGIDSFYQKGDEELKVKERGSLARIFQEWFDHSQTQKKKWQKMIRFRYLLNRMKLNRIILSWKVQIRKIKVQRLQYTIASHEHYKRVLHECFTGLRQATLAQKVFRGRIENVIDKSDIICVVDAFEMLKDESRRVLIIGNKGERLAKKHIIFQKQMIFKALAEYREHRYQMATNRLVADKLRDKLLLKIHFKAIHTFSKLKDRKLAAIRTVNQYLQEKRAKRVLHMLRTNLNMIKSKEQNLRQACQFHLFRRPHFIALAAFQALKLYRQTKQKARKPYRLCFLFKAMRQSLNQQKIETNKTAEGSKVQLYTMMGDTLPKDSNDALSVFKICQNELRQSFQKQDGAADGLLNNIEEQTDGEGLVDFRLSIDSVIAGQKVKKAEEKFRSSMSKCLDRVYVPKIEQLRTNMLVQAIEKAIELGPLKRAFNKLLTLQSLAQQENTSSSHQSNIMETFAAELESEEHKNLLKDFDEKAGDNDDDNIDSYAWYDELSSRQHVLALKRRAMTGLQRYLQCKQEQAIKGALARKFNYMRRLKSVLQMLRSNICHQRNERRKRSQSDFHFKKAMLARFFSVFKQADSLSKHRQMRLVTHLDRHRIHVLARLFTELTLHRDNRQEKRMKVGMAQLKSQRSLLLSHFKVFKVLTGQLREKHSKQQNKIAKVQSFRYRRLLAKIMRALHLHSIRSKVHTGILKTVQEKTGKRILAETIMRWKIFKLQRMNEQISCETADDHFASRLKQQAIQAFLNYQNRQQKQNIQDNFARGKRHAYVKRQAMQVFLWYIQYRKDKKSAYEKARNDRKRIQTQKTLFKLLQVASYWRQKQGTVATSSQSESHNELQQKRSFTKWKNMTSFNTSPSKRPQASQHKTMVIKQIPAAVMIKNGSDSTIPKKHHSLNSQVVDHHHQQTLDWLYSFDQVKTGNLPQTQQEQQQTAEPGLLTKAAAHQRHQQSHISSIKEFDQFLETMNPNPVSNPNTHNTHTLQERPNVVASRISHEQPKATTAAPHPSGMVSAFDQDQQFRPY